MQDAEESRSRSPATLVLSSGGMRGLAHVGARKALSRAGVQIERIVGTSIGALVGAALATGISLEELEERARGMSRRDVAVPWRWPWWARGTPYPGLLRGDVIRDFVEDLLPEDPEGGLSTPLDVGAVDLESGELVWFTYRPGSDATLPSGSEPGSRPALVDAVLASTAIPIFYPPVEIGGRSFVDGGVLAPLPVRRAVDLGAERIIAVDVRSDDEEQEVPVSQKGLLAVSMRTLSIAVSSQSSWHATAPAGHDLERIEPPVDDVGCFDFAHNDRLLDEGYRAAVRVLERRAATGDGTGPAPEVPPEPRKLAS